MEYKTEKLLQYIGQLWVEFTNAQSLIAEQQRAIQQRDAEILKLREKFSQVQS